ncbi:MAG: apolipoprotein N-acyltransferase [Thermodesulfobacteriota bacterium]
MKIMIPWFFAVLSGLLGFLGYVGYGLFFLEWVFLVPLLWAMRAESPGRAFLLGWLAGTVGHAGGFYWLVHMLTVFAGLSVIPAVIALLAYAAYNGVSFALVAWCVRRLQQRSGWSPWWTAPLAWAAMEQVFPFVFPNYIGASQHPLPPLTQLADITGIIGVSAVLIWGNATIYRVMAQRVAGAAPPLREVGLFLLAVTAAAVYGVWRISAIDAAAAKAPKIRVAVIQAGKGEAFKHHRPDEFVRIHQEMSRTAVSGSLDRDVDLVVWPESVITSPLHHRAAAVPCRLTGATGKPVLFGALTMERKAGERKKYTGAMLIDGGCRVRGTYHKRILVPFGEYIPFGDRFPFLYRHLPYTSRFSPGEDSTPLRFRNYRFSVNICYEDLFPRFVRQGMRAEREDGLLPHAIINLTNDSWYGDTAEPMQHLVLASFRAIEHRRSLVRATNTGISAIVDPVGRLNNRTGQWTREILRGDVPMMEGGTFYSRAGNWFGWTACVLTAGWLAHSFRSGRSGKRNRRLRR